jgi:hypothetical protein
MIPQPEVQQVEEIDREVAALVARLLTGAAVDRILEGFEDDTGTVQAFARHRAAAFEAGRAEGVREGLSRAEMIARSHQSASDDLRMAASYAKRTDAEWWHAGAKDASSNIARALSKEPTK